jgi:xanthine/CO dehydrogenase XdhC/CoxF family maturation factor
MRRQQLHESRFAKTPKVVAVSAVAETVAIFNIERLLKGCQPRSGSLKSH